MGAIGDGIVLGASSGVGRALVEMLANAGSIVTALSRRGVVPGLENENVLPAAVDVRNFPELEQAVAEASARHAVDYVVNCIGVGFYAPIGADYSGAWNDILTSNVTGLLNLLSVVERQLPDLRQFVHLSSMAAHRVSRTPGNLCYSVSKAAARTVVEEYRQELRAKGRMTRVSMVSPGFIEGTEFGEHFFSRAPDVPPVNIYAGHANLTPPDVAELVVCVLRLPGHAEVVDLLVRPTEQPL
jgi:NADP-dependent 3-hydroxy acid dehydrogenase YdfG